MKEKILELRMQGKSYNEIQKKLGYDLTKHEVSIVNVGSTAYLHFAKIFQRTDDRRDRA